MITKEQLDAIELNAVNQGYEGWEDVIRLCREYTYLAEERARQVDLFVVGIHAGVNHGQDALDRERARTDEAVERWRLCKVELDELKQTLQSGDEATE